jgi:hypothetical protein
MLVDSNGKLVKADAKATEFVLRPLREVCTVVSHYPTDGTFSLGERARLQTFSQKQRAFN